MNTDTLIRSQRRQVLIVEDEAINRELLGFILQDSYDILYAENGLEALHELVRASSLPHFVTDLTLRLYGCNPQRAYVSISDDAAVEHFYCYCRKEDEKRYLAWFQALERRFL